MMVAVRGTALCVDHHHYHAGARALNIIAAGTNPIIIMQSRELRISWPLSKSQLLSQFNSCP